MKVGESLETGTLNTKVAETGTHADKSSKLNTHDMKEAEAGSKRDTSLEKNHIRHESSRNGYKDR